MWGINSLRSIRKCGGSARGSLSLTGSRLSGGRLSDATTYNMNKIPWIMGGSP